jgi:hypothetical protein
MTQSGIEMIKNGDDMLAIVIYKDYQKEGTTFFTPPEFSQQLAFISRKKGASIAAHTHALMERNIQLTQEVLLVKSGRVKVNLYDGAHAYISSRELVSGDIILLASGGHGFEFLEDTQMVEVKQGPYVNDESKVGFKGIENHDSRK